MRCPPPPGFTLIETLFVIGMVAILATIAYPSLRAPVLKARRSDAQVALMQLQLAQERWRAGHSRYGTLAELSAPPLSPLGHYRLTVEAPGATGFTLQAEAIGPQADDTSCRVLRLSRVEGHTLYTSGPEPAAGAPQNTHRLCWTS